MRASILLVVGVIVAACGGSTAESSGNAAGASSAACAGKCDAQLVPDYRCVGGRVTPRCNERSDGVCRWQIDCVPRDPSAPPDPDDLRGISQCREGDCGADPVLDADACMYGLASQVASCESFDRAPCKWAARCLPKPCSREEGTCNTLDRGRLGEPCSGKKPCPSGSQCASIAVNIGERVDPVCIAGNPCDALTCAGGLQCMILDSFPAQITCGR